jgi:hypothetical protein
MKTTHTYPGNPETARRVQDEVARATGDPLPRHAAEPAAFSRAIEIAQEDRR